MGGKENGSEVVRAFEACLNDPQWQANPGPKDPYGFHHPVDYRVWLQEAGLIPDAVDLVEKDMIHASADALVGYLRTAWLPYTERVSEDRRQSFTEEVVTVYLRDSPVDHLGRAHVRMVRLQVLAHKARFS
jgi:trans-aconitate methyltransferase